MTEIVKIWLEDLFDNELQEIEGSIENNKVWLADARTPAEYEETGRTIAYLEEYRDTIKKFQAQVKEA